MRQLSYSAVLAFVQWLTKKIDDNFLIINYSLTVYIETINEENFQRAVRNVDFILTKFYWNKYWKCASLDWIPFTFCKYAKKIASHGRDAHLIFHILHW